MDKVVVVTLYRRPGYTRQTLNALADCFGIENYHVLFSIDYADAHAAACEEVIALAKEWKASPYGIHIHAPRLGIDENKLWALPLALAMLPNRPDAFFIALEDDMKPARDFLQFMEWGARAYFNDKGILSLCGYNRHDEVERAQLYDAWVAQGFHAWGWGMWRDRWERFFTDDAKEYHEYAGAEANGRFDWYLTDMAKKHNLWTVQPVIARVMNFGVYNGEHTQPEHFLATEYNPRGAWDVQLTRTPQEWRVLNDIPHPAI
jgi:hypothetical protein